jgi:ABC-2 type transport system permease protein
MWMICKKEWQQFFSTITGYIAIILFLILNGLYLFVFAETSVLDFGYANLNSFFAIAPWLFLFLVPTVTMRSIAEEVKIGTFEILRTLPLTPMQIVCGKFFGAILITVAALLPTVVYPICLQQLSSVGGIDVGATIGSYIGLLLLGIAYTAIGIFTSSLTQNTIVAFLVGAFICLLMYIGFDAISKLPFVPGGLAYYIELIGINFHYKSISKGVLDVKDVVYFAALSVTFLWLTRNKLMDNSAR